MICCTGSVPDTAEAAPLISDVIVLRGFIFRFPALVNPCGLVDPAPFLERSDRAGRRLGDSAEFVKCAAQSLRVSFPRHMRGPGESYSAWRWNFDYSATSRRDSTGNASKSVTSVSGVFLSPS
jgi:hypothetical protein